MNKGTVKDCKGCKELAEIRDEYRSTQRLCNAALSNTEQIRKLADNLGMREGKYLPGSVASVALEKIEAMTLALEQATRALKEISSEKCFDADCICCGIDGKIAKECLEKLTRDER